MIFIPPIHARLSLNHLRQRLTSYLYVSSRGSVSPPISQTLAFDTNERLINANLIIHTNRDTIAIAEVELGQIAVEMLSRAMLVDANHAALEHREVAFDGVRVD